MCVMDENGQILDRGQAGEVCVRGYSTMLGYWDDAEQTQKAIDSRRWFHMGLEQGVISLLMNYLFRDVGVMNEDESLVIVGRIKDMIIRGGENIYPTEIENLILTHPSVKDVHVVGKFFECLKIVSNKTKFNSALNSSKHCRHSGRTLGRGSLRRYSTKRQLFHRLD